MKEPNGSLEWIRPRQYTGTDIMEADIFLLIKSLELTNNEMFSWKTHLDIDTINYK